MKNPDKQSAHEKRICRKLDLIEAEMNQLEEEPATPYNRLRLIQLKLRASVLFNSWFTKDPQETYVGMQLLTEEDHLRSYYLDKLNRVNSLLKNTHLWEDQQVDLSGVEAWVEGPLEISVN